MGWEEDTWIPRERTMFPTVWVPSPVAVVERCDKSNLREKESLFCLTVQGHCSSWWGGDRGKAAGGLEA